MHTHRKNIKKISILAIAILLILSLTGCNIWGIINTAADKAKILQIGKNIEKALQQKDVSLFMQNISYDYSDTDGHTFYTVDGLAEELISQVEEIEDLADSAIKDVSIGVSLKNLVLAELYANSEMDIEISVKYFNVIPPFWPTDNYPKIILFDIDFQKNGYEWEITSMEEK
jgi:hypothetical protein